MTPLSLWQLWSLVIVCGARAVQGMQSPMLVSMKTYQVFKWLQRLPADYVDYVADRGID